MKQTKSIALFLALSLMLSISIFAASTQKDITIELPGISVYLDGNKITPKDGGGNAAEPFLYNGNVYVPIQIAGQASGKTVIWDSKTNTVNIGKKAASTSNPAPKKEVIVYITKTGAKYHTASCSYLSKSKISISLGDAKKQGYTPCSRCKPPS